MKKLFTILMALAMVSSVYARKVKFSVDMTGQTVSSNGVHIAGNFQGWSPSNTLLTKEGTTNIYSIITNVDSLSVIEYKFLNGITWGDAESVPAICQKGHANNGNTNDNRWFFSTLGNDTIVLPAFKFSGSAPAGKRAVRFAVDLKNVAVNGTAFVAGSFQGWNATGTPMTNLYNANKLYEAVVVLDSGDYQYKFINGTDWESVPSTCATGGNRTLSVRSTDVTIGKVCLGSCAACPTAPIPKYNVTFRVDMTNTNCDGNIDSVSVAGGKIPGAWGNGTTMAKVGTTSVYSVTLAIDSGELEFKYRWHKNNNTNWEGIANRKFNLTKDTVLNANCFSTTSACVPKPATSVIKFYADLIDVTPSDTIWIMGSFTRPNWQAGKVQMKPVAGYPFLFGATVSICDGSFAYKFVNGKADVTANEEFNGDTAAKACNESNGLGGFNRSYTRTSTDTIVISYKFGKCDIGRKPIPTGVLETNVMDHVRIFPNPSASDVTITLDDNMSYEVNIVDIAGRQVYHNNVHASELHLNKSELGDGLFFVTVRSDKGAEKTVKLLMQ